MTDIYMLLTTLSMVFLLLTNYFLSKRIDLIWDVIKRQQEINGVTLELIELMKKVTKDE